VQGEPSILSALLFSRVAAGGSVVPSSAKERPRVHLESCGVRRVLT